MRILIAAGGSGGHIFPAIALASAMKKKEAGVSLRFIGSNKALDRRIFEKEGLDFSLLSANKLPYKASWQLLLFFLKLLFDITKSLFIIVSYRPDTVIGFGGYVPCPVMVIAYMFRIPIVVHEQNVVPGRANKLLFRLADKIAISFEDTKRFLGADIYKAVFTGNPIRREAFYGSSAVTGRVDALKRFGLDAAKFTVFVIGGSQGAHFLNEAFIKALSKLDGSLRSSLQVIHITGIKDYDWAVGLYKDLGFEHRVYSFIDRIEEAYGASDLIITRSGASAIFEIAFFGKPMILVPYPFAMSHQVENARAFSQKGAAIEIDEKDLSDEVFRKNILGLFNDRSRLDRLAESAKRLSVPEASDNLADTVLALGKR